MPDGRLVSFIRDNFGAPPPGTVPDPSQIERQMALAQSLQQQRASSPPVTNVLQGLNQLAQAAVSGMAGRRAQQGMEARNNAAAETFSGLVDWSAFGIDPAQGRQLAALNPEIPTMLWQMQLEQQANRQPALIDATVNGYAGQRNPVTNEFSPYPEYMQPQAPPPEYRPLTAEERAVWGIPPEDQRLFVMGPEGPEVRGGSGVNVEVNTGDEVDPRPMVANPEQGYQRVWDANAQTWRDEPIPGSGAAQDVQAAADAAEVARQGELTSAGIVLQDIDTALGLSGGWTTGFIGNLTRAIPGTPSYDLARTLDTIKANVGFDQLQQMRDSSPTGGALGQVSEQENRLLQSVLGNLEQSQSRPQFEANLQRLKNVYLDIIHGAGNWSVGEDGAVLVGDERLGQTPALDGIPPPPDFNKAALEQRVEAAGDNVGAELRRIAEEYGVTVNDVLGWLE